ncbi:alpha-glucosidase, partial [Vitellibacter sp. q18]|nr:alpha-glucosidase [Aequorivita lutea]
LYERSHNGERMMVALNLSGQSVDIELPAGAKTVVSELSVLNAEWSDARVHLPAYGIGICQLA